MRKGGIGRYRRAGGRADGSPERETQLLSWLCAGVSEALCWQDEHSPNYANTKHTQWQPGVFSMCLTQQCE